MANKIGIKYVAQCSIVLLHVTAKYM